MISFSPECQCIRLPYFVSSNLSVATMWEITSMCRAGNVTIAKQDGNEKFVCSDQNQSFEVNFGNLFADSTGV